MRHYLWEKELTLVITVLFLGMNFFPFIITEKNEIDRNIEYQINKNSYYCILDYYYIKNITKALSDIIFMYNESHGEIARGREFGSPGEHEAARMIFENMTSLGLWTYKEKIGEVKPWQPINLLSAKMDVMDYKLIIHNKTINQSVVCSPIVADIGFRPSPLRLTQNISYINLSLRTNLPSSDQDKEPYMLLSGNVNQERNTIQEVRQIGTARGFRIIDISDCSPP